MIGADAPLPVRLRRRHVEAAMPFHPTRRRLLAAGALGAAHLVLDDAFAQSLAPTPQCHDGGAPTIRETEGPYFKPSSPQRADLVEPESKARLVELSGQVFTRSCRPVGQALVDLWHADERGQYDNAGFRYHTSCGALAACFHAVGLSNAPLLGSTAAEDLPRIGRTSIATRWRPCGLPQSASCSRRAIERGV